MDATVSGKSVERELDQDRDGMLSSVIVAWTGMVLYFDPRIAALVPYAPSFFSAAAVWLFLACLNFFWLHAVYQLCAIIWSVRVRQYGTSVRTARETLAMERSPRVAILYATRNDFREECADSCLSLQYSNYHLFILDDGTLPEYRDRINRWAGRDPAKVSIVRRDNCVGFKAGNLNNALRQIHAEYPYFVVADADTILPLNFIAELLPRMEEDASLAFIQARQEQNEEQPEQFARDLGVGIGVHYRYNVTARAESGFLMFYGHGALMRTSTWRDVGGFPEIATEDLAYSALARAKGWRGSYADDVICYEDFPADYQRLRTRTDKWIRGTTEALFKHGPAFLRAHGVPWHEKVDLLINASSHYLSTAMLVFIVAIGAFLPASFDHFRYTGSFFLPPVPGSKPPLELLLQTRYHIFWSWDFFLAMMVTIVVPLIPAGIALRGHPVRFMRHVVASQFLFLATMLADARSVFAYMTTRRADFRNTNDAGTRTSRSWWPAAEFAAGLVFFALAFSSGNLWLFAPGIALVASPLIARNGWESRSIRFASVTAAIIGFVILAFVSIQLTRPHAAVATLASVELRPAARGEIAP